MKKKKRYIKRTPPIEKKKRKKKRNKKKRKKKERCQVGIELANFDWIVRWFHPLRYSGMNQRRAFTLPFCTTPHFCRLIPGTYVSGT